MSFSLPLSVFMYVWQRARQGTKSSVTPDTHADRCFLSFLSTFPMFKSPNGTSMTSLSFLTSAWLVNSLSATSQPQSVWNWRCPSYFHGVINNFPFARPGWAHSSWFLSHSSAPLPWTKSAVLNHVKLWRSCDTTDILQGMSRDRERCFHLASGFF